jgi:hypothetical protein
MSGFEIAVLGTASFFAYFLKGFSGFGPALIFVPVFALFFNPAIALTASTVVDIFAGALMIYSLLPSREEAKVIFRLSIFLLVGTAAGALFLGTLPTESILGLIGLITFVFGANILLFHKAIPGDFKSENPALIWGGSFFCGFFSTLVGTGGPFIVFGAKKAFDKNKFRKILVSVFLIEAMLKVVAYHWLGIWSGEAVRLAFIFSPAIIAGLAIGSYLHNKTKEIHFDLIVGTLLLLIAVRILYQVFL